ncbi:MAG: OsmC family protein, partial [Alphaproteobacteria bacterium]|nr:OsmC family protein [Alphaproteobacteria bacterium]
SAATETAWRFVCDEGEHLGGFNQAPNPLTYLSAGMISSYMNEITALADQRDINLGNIELVLENYYYREGDFRKGTMMSGALPPELTVHCDADCDDAILSTLLYEAVAASPLNGLARGSHPSLFTLVHNGRVLTPEQVTPLDAEPFDDPGDNFPKLERLEDSPAVDGLIEMLVDEDSAREAHAKLELDQPQLGEDKQLLHMHTRCVLRPDGVKEIFKEQYSPVAPTWRFLSAEDGRAPDAASLISAGIGLCFMTQMGRFSHMGKLPLTSYRIIQDTHFSLGGASGGTGQAGTAEPVETHVFLETDDLGDDDAQQILGVGERTCFLHAFCRDDVKAKVRSSKAAKAA